MFVKIIGSYVKFEDVIEVSDEITKFELDKAATVVPAIGANRIDVAFGPSSSFIYIADNSNDMNIILDRLRLLRKRDSLVSA